MFMLYNVRYGKKKKRGKCVVNSYLRILLPTCSTFKRLNLFIIPHVNFSYKTSIDERLIFYNITRCYSDGEYCRSFAIAAGDII